MSTRSIILIVIGSFLVSLSYGQNLSSQQINTSDGLSQGVIFDMLQDSKGFMWFGTKAGLNRYDGYRFEVFTNDPDDPWSIASNTVTFLYEDSKNRIWVATENSGVDIYDPETGKFHHIIYDPANKDGITGNKVINIIEDRAGHFILNVMEREINVLQLEDSFFKEGIQPRITLISIPKISFDRQTPSSHLRGIAKDGNGRIWAGGHEKLYEIDIQNGNMVLATEGFSIGTSITTPDGSIWSCGHHQRMFNWDGQQARLIPDGLYQMSQLAQDNQGNFWGVRADSLFHFTLPSASELKEYKSEILWKWTPDIPSTDYPLLSIEIDDSGLIWVGTNGFGLFKLNPTRNLFNHKLPGISVRNFNIVSKNKYYLNSYSAWWDEKNSSLGLDPFSVTDPNNGVENMLIESDGDIWMTHMNFGDNVFKLLEFSEYEGVRRIFEIPWLHDDVQPMYQTRDGHIWLGGFGKHLTEVDPVSGKVTTYDLNTGLPKTIDNNAEKELVRGYTTAIYEDLDGTMWIGYEDGFVRCQRNIEKENQFTVQHIKNVPGDNTSISYNHVSCFLEDPVLPDRYLWIGTKGGGLNRLDKKTEKFLRISIKEGLPDNVVYGILADNDNNLWGSTNKGVFCLSRSSIEDENYSFKNFSEQDGLQAEEFNTGAYAKLLDGRMMFGGVNGYNVFNPEEVLRKDFLAPVHITKLLINNIEVRPKDDFGILDRSILSTKDIQLNADHQIITLEYAALDYTVSDKIKYRYQLQGADDNWVEAGIQRTATFLNLPPKDYTFRVQATNSQGTWSNHTAALEITVNPPWWKTSWAYLLYAFIIGGITLITTRFFIRRSQLQQQLAFEKKEAERIKTLDEQKTQLYTNITHEFRTPLTIILGMAQQLKENPGHQVESGYDMIIRNGKNLLELVNKLLSLSKLESGQLTVNYVEGDVILFLRSLVSSFHSLVEQKEIQLHFLPELNSYFTSYDPDKLQQIVSNLISNAYKFTPEGGNIYLLVKADDHKLLIRVKDTGVGIENSELSKIFDRFYQIDPSSTRSSEGSGIGLALTQELTTLLGGSITVQSPPIGANKGTEFLVTFPAMEVGSTLSDAKSPKISTPYIPRRPVNISQIAPLAQIEADRQFSSAGVQSLKSIPAKDSSRSTILLVEDNQDVVVYITSCLNNPSSDREKYHLMVAENGQEGMQIAQEQIPDLIISDVMMPIMDGFELCQRIKTNEVTDHIPVILLTAKSDQHSKLEGLEKGANAYLAKPFARQELLFTVQNLLSLRKNLQRSYQSIYQPESRDKLKTDKTGLTHKLQETENQFVKKIHSYIESNLENSQLDVGELASFVNLSHSQLARKLQALTGYSPNRFIRLIRLQKAKELLRDKETNISIVAYKCGFNDPSYFTRLFKKEMGITPTEWMDQVH